MLAIDTDTGYHIL